MPTTYTLKDLKKYHKESIEFFGSQLMILKDVIPKITDDRLSKSAVLLISSGQTGAALLQLAIQIDMFTSESVMLARSFMEKTINFCYTGVCNEKQFRAFILHPIYKHYHNVDSVKMEDNFDSILENRKVRKKEQERLKEIPIVKEALTIFSESNPRINWTKKTLNQRIITIRESKKVLDTFFTLSKLEYYSDASESLHGSLYGCTYNTGMFDPNFKRDKKDELEKKLYKENACVLLHLGMLIHESLTLITYSSDIKKNWSDSYKNRGRALNLLFHILEKDISDTTNSKL